jgi:GR25 family glycosyltransferase involved in LPS biosynthesis
VYTTSREQTSGRNTDSSFSLCWDFFDKIYCISIDDRIDRREQAEKQFSRVGLQDRLEFVIVTRHPENREQGIFESHMHCLQKGLGAGARCVLVFEDDVFFQNFDARSLSTACAYLEHLTAWNGFFLGCITAGNRKTKEKSLLEIKYRCLAHAYALNHSFMQRLVQETWKGIPFDELMRRHQDNFFALYPMCAFQGLSGSDNQTVVIDRMRRVFGGLPFIQKVNQFYQNHKVFFLLFHIAVFATLAGIALGLAE